MGVVFATLAIPLALSASWTSAAWALQAVGIILVVAMLIAPGATAFLLARRFDTMLAISAAVAIGSSVMGTLISYAINAAAGASIVLVQAAVFVVALVLKGGLFRRPVSPQT